VRDILLSDRMENHKSRDNVTLDLPGVIMFGVCIMKILDLGLATNKPGPGKKAFPQSHYS
jgi:hypothetical protein